MRSHANPSAAPSLAHPRSYKLFLALFPPRDTARHITLRMDAWCRRQQLVLARLAPERLHITLQVLGDFLQAVPEEQVQAARAAAATVNWFPVPITHHRVQEFVHGRAMVLLGDADSDAAVKQLQQVLALALRRVGLQFSCSRTPHMTLGYGCSAQVPAPGAIDPLRWTATEFALILSHTGLTHHERQGQWPLTRPSAGQGRAWAPIVRSCP